MVIDQVEESASTGEYTVNDYNKAVEAAYGRVNTEGFKFGEYVFDAFQRWTAVREGGQPSSMALAEMQVDVSETLGNSLNRFDTPGNAQEYERLASTVRAMTPEQKAFCRMCIKGAEALVNRVDPNGEFGKGEATNAQLMALLA